MILRSVGDQWEHLCAILTAKWRLCSLHHPSDDALTGDGQEAPARSLSSGNWRSREEANLPLFSYSEIFPFTALSKNNNKFQSDV